MRKGFNRILLAVRDVDTVTPALLRKVGALVASSRARIEVYHAIAEPIVLVPPRGKANQRDFDAVLAAAAARSQQKLEKAVHRARPKGVRITCRADWDYPAFEAIVRRATAIKADLVVAVVRKHAPTARVFLRNVDWELIRFCPVPLLLLKSSRPWKRPAVLAAVDPLHADDKPAKLDRQLLAVGKRLAEGLRGKVHMVHAWQPLSLAMTPMPGAPGPIWMPRQAEDQHAAAIESAFARLARSAGVPPARRHLVLGSVPDAFAEAQRASRAQIMAMGAISRRGIQRLLIGNTAERMLDEVPCDVLVVKPARFPNKVPSKARGPTPATLVPPL